jgi:hypothetical protein
MPNDACNPHNAVAKMAGVFDAGGIETTEGALNRLDDNAKTLFHQIRSQSSAQALQKTSPKAAKTAEEIIEDVTDENADKGTIIERVKGGLLDVMKPADFLPEDVTGPVFEYLDNFFVANHQDMVGARKSYSAGIRKVLNEISETVDGLSPEAKGQAAHWMRDLREGYPFYGKSGTILNNMTSNVVSNALDFSTNVLLGNPLEIIIKAPAVYGIRPTFNGLGMLAKETKGNLWATIPELEQAGVYGMEMPKGKGKIASLQNAYNYINEKVMNVTDRPLKNWAYYTGKAQNGNGMEAVEKIAFKNRWGNDARLGRSNRDAVTLMNYTFNTYYMFGGMAKNIITPGKRAEGLRQFGMWAGLTSLIGGPAAVIPAPLAEVLKQNAEYAEFEKNYLFPTGKLIRPGGVTFGVGYEMVNRAGDVWFRGLKKGAEKLSKDDPQGAMLDFADGGLGAATVFTRSPLGNLRVQKVLRNTRDLYEGDLDGDYLQKNAEAVFPIIKQAK